MPPASLKEEGHGTSLVVQWLRLCASNARGTGVFAELRFCVPHGMAKKKEGGLWNISCRSAVRAKERSHVAA